MSKVKEHFGNKLEFHFSSKEDGPMNFVGHEFYDGERRANRAMFLKYKLGAKATDTVVPKPMHTGRAEVVDTHNPIYGVPACDAVITGKKGLVLTMTAGDCPPVVLYDPVNEVAALIHAGWKPLVAGIIANTLEAMRIQLNCHAGNIKAYIGPGICRQCYEVREDVWKKFGYPADLSPSGKYYLSLSEEIDKRLQEGGVSKMNILATTECTMHTGDGEKYFSWRGDRSDPLETNMAALVLR